MATIKIGREKKKKTNLWQWWYKKYSLKKNNRKGLKRTPENKLIESGQELATGYKQHSGKFGHWGQVFARHLWAHRTHSFQVISLLLFFIFKLDSCHACNGLQIITSSYKLHAAHLKWSSEHHEMSISFYSNILAGSSPHKSKFVLALFHLTAAPKSPSAPQKRNTDIQIATAKDSAEALNVEWWSHGVLQFYIIIFLPLSSKEKNPSWKHFSSGGK